MALHPLTTLALALLALLLSRSLLSRLAARRRRHAFAASHACLPPSRWPSRDPTSLGLDIVIGNVRAFKSHTLLSRFQSALATYSPPGSRTTMMSILGTRALLTADPRNLQVMHALDFGKWSIGNERNDEGRAMGKLLGKGVFTTEGDEWKGSRELLRGCFERKFVEDVSLFERHFGELLKAVQREGMRKEEDHDEMVELDLQPLFSKLSLDISTEFLFGESTGCLAVRNQEGEAFAEAFEFCQNPFAEKEGTKGKSFYALWVLVDVLQDQWPKYFPNREYVRCQKIVHDFVDALVAKGLQPRISSDSNPARPTFLSTLAAYDTPPSSLRLRSESLNILLAGRDTTAALLSNLVWSLSRCPPTLARLREEIASHLGASAPTYTQLKSMRYLRAVLNESLRLHPVVPQNVRSAATNTVLPYGGGKDGNSPVFVSKDEFVMFSVYDMHRREDIWGPDAAEWRPERWIDGEGEGEKLRPGWAYLPFGGGPRICIGQQFALAEVGYITVRLLQDFAILESRDTEPWQEKISITCSNQHGCKVALAR